jgi:proteasome alpha subunit
MDEQGFTVLGGQADTILEALQHDYEEGLELDAAVRLGARVLAPGGDAVPADQLEVALLDRERTLRAFRRIKGDELDALVSG